MRHWRELDGIRFGSACSRLERALARPLPGGDAQLLMAPGPRRPGWQPGIVPADARPSAALVLLYPARGGRAGLVLTERATGLGRHAGQVSLPGGALDDGETFEHAALREAREEIGVDPRTVRVLGRLSPLHIPISRFALHPVVARRDERPRFVPDPREVACVVETTLDALADPARHGRETMERPQGRLDVPFFAIGERKVWGATAMVLAELLSALAAKDRRAR